MPAAGSEAKPMDGGSLSPNSAGPTSAARRDGIGQRDHGGAWVVLCHGFRPLPCGVCPVPRAGPARTDDWPTIGLDGRALAFVCGEHHEEPCCSAVTRSLLAAPAQTGQRPDRRRHRLRRRKLCRAHQQTADTGATSVGSDPVRGIPQAEARVPDGPTNCRGRSKASPSLFPPIPVVLREIWADRSAKGQAQVPASPNATS